MQDRLKRILVLITVIGMCMLMFMYYSVEKSGMFIDEIYSYGLSNGEYTPFISDTKNRDIVDTVFSKEEFTDYLMVDDDEGFDFDSVYYNQTKDVHPPLYYFLLNAVSSVFRGTFTKWTGLLLNSVIYLLTLVTLYKIAKKLFGEGMIPYCAVLLYGISNMGLSTALMIRMYCLMTFLSVLLLYLLISFDENKRWYKAVFIGLTIFAGLMTHYYFVIYAFFVCLAFLIRFIRRREYKPCVLFAVLAITGVAAMVAVFPAVIDHLFADKLVSGGSAYSNIADPLGYPKRIAKFALDIVMQMPVVVLIGVIALICVIVLARKNKAEFKEYLSKSYVLSVMVPAVLALCVAAILAPVHTERYIYNLAPAFVLIVGYLVSIAIKLNVDNKSASIMRTVFVILAVIPPIVCAYLLKPDYIFAEHIEYNEAVAEYSNEVCLYFNDNYNSPLTQDLLQLKEFDEVFVTNSAESAALEEYLTENGSPDSLVVYIDVSEFWSSGFVSEEILDGLMEKYGYSSYEVLYKYGLSETYVLNK